MLDKFADELRAQREKSGLSLQQLANKTRIDLKFLEAIDIGNFAFLPELYVRAFVKQYAKTVGLDENVIIKKFDAAKEGRLYEENSAAEEPEKQPDAPREEKPSVQPPPTAPPVKSYVDETKQKPAADGKKNNNRYLVLGLIAASAVIVFLLLYIFVFKQSTKIVVEETPYEEVVQDNSQRYIQEEPEAGSSTVNEQPVSFSADSLYLTFTASESSWVYLVVDNVRTQEFTLKPNIKFTVAASREFKATIGNSGGVKLTMNNKQLDFAGRPGSVKYIKLDRTGLSYLSTPPKLEQ